MIFIFLTVYEGIPRIRPFLKFQGLPAAPALTPERPEVTSPERFATPASTRHL